MACKIEKINNKELESLVVQYGATEGLKKFLNKDEGVKEGVDFVFEQNPELANVVYKALGFKPNKLSEKEVSDILYRTNEYRVELFPNLNSIFENSARLKGFNIVPDKAAINFLEKIKDVAQQNKDEIKIEYSTIEENVDNAINNIYKGNYGEATALGEKAISYIHDAFARYIISEGIANISDLSYSLTPEQRQQALQQYSKYLDTIFPESKVKDIVYHGANEPIEGEEFTKRVGSTGGGIWFSGSRKYAQLQMDRAQPSESLIGRKLRGAPTMYQVVLNIKNPKHFYDATGALLVQTPREFEKQYDRTVNDAALFHHPNSKKPATADSADQVVVSEPEQIHILGSEQDIEGFKEFVNKSNTKYLIDPNQTNIDFEEQGKDFKGPMRELGLARKEWEAFTKLNMYDPMERKHSNVGQFFSKLNTLRDKYKHLIITYKDNGKLGLEITVKNPDYKYFNPYDNGMGGIKLPKFLIDTKTKPTKINPIGEVVIRRKMMIELLKNKLNEAGRGTSQASEIKARIIKIENSVQKILEDNSIKAVLDVGNSQYVEIRNKLNSIKETLDDNDLDSEALKQSMDTLVELDHYIDTWLDLNELFDVQFGESYEREFSDLVGNYNGLKNGYKALLQNALVRYANKESYKTTFTKDEMFGNLADTSWGTKNFQGLNHSNAEIARFANDTIKRATSKINNDFIDKKTGILEAVNKLTKATGLSELESFKKILQFNAKGEWTGNLLTEYKQEYYDKLKLLKSQRKSKIITWAQYWKAVSEMQNHMTQEILDNNDTSIFSKEEIELQKAKLKTYEQDLKAYRQSLIDSGEYDIPGEDTTDYAMLEADVNNWKNSHSPTLYWKDIAKGDFTKLPKYAHDYIIEPKAKTEWHDKNYKSMIQTPYLKEFYEFISKIFTENNSYFPDNFQPHQKNFLPETRKGFVEELKKDKGLSLLKGLSGDLIDAITIQETGRHDNRTIIGGKIIKSVPISMMKNRLTPEQKSMDLKAIMLQHTAMALNYKHKTDILPIVNAVQDLVDEMHETELSHSGNHFKENKFGIKVDMGKKLRNTKEHLAFTIDTLMFGDARENMFTAEKGMFLSKEEKELKQELKTKLDNKEITQEEYDIKISDLGKKLSGEKIGDGLIKLTYLKALSFPNFVSPAVNLFFGVLSNYSYAAGGKDFTDKDIGKATLIMFKAVSKTLGKKFHSEMVEKVFAWMEQTNLFGNVLEGLEPGKMSISEKAVILQMKAEHINQGSVMVAMLLNKKVKDTNGKEVSLWNAYKVVNGRLTWDETKLGRQPDVIQNEILNGNMVNLERLGFQIKDVAERIHGDYTQPMGIKKTIVGRMFMLFRTWLPATLKERFGKLDYNQNLQRNIKGRYISIFSSKDNADTDVNMMKSFSTFAKLIITQNYLTKGMAKKSLENFSEVDIENLKRAAREAQIIMALTIVTLLLKSLGSDDDDEKRAINLMVNTLSKISTDMMFFFNPMAMMGVAKNPVPVLKTITEFVEILPIAIKTISGKPYYENGPWKDQLRIVKWGFNNVPIGGAAAAKMYTLSADQY